MEYDKGFKTKKTIQPRIKLNHNIYTSLSFDIIIYTHKQA